MTTNDYPHIRKHFDLEWRLKSRRLLPERDDIAAAKREHDARLEAALTKARNEDAALRERTGGSVVDRLTRASAERDARRDRRQGFAGEDAITHDLLDRVDADLADVGQVKSETVAELARRLNAQFPSGEGPYNAQTGSLRAVLMLQAKRRGKAGAR
ncbi:hypothetical protein [Glycomyces sp. MUSA5-2]|uniref:hypothetical protein n=1 Tax=Glycomyces sp. MUSA5-2 TaxID=2053002 RepID=UPI00300A96C2